MEQTRKRTLRYSLQIRYALTYILVIAAVLVLLNIYPIRVAEDLTFKSKQDSLQSQTAVMASALAGLESLSTDGVDRVIGQLDLTGYTRVLVTDYNCMVLYDSSETGGARYRYALLQEVEQALQGNTVFYSAFRDDMFQSRAASPVVYRNNIIGTVVLYEEDAEQAALLQGVQSNLGFLSLVIMAIVLFLSVIFSRAFTARISTLGKSMEIVREGNYSHRVKVKGTDEMTRLAQEFNQLTDRLQTTEEVRRRFVSDASHELKTPLASIRLLTDSILQSDTIDMETTREFVADIGEEADRLIRISERLLTLSRLDARQEIVKKPVNLKEVVLQVDHMLAPLARAAQVELEYDLPEDCVLQANEDDLHQIVFNLMENAIKYNLPGGRVWVRVRQEAEDVVIQVEDNGVGIPEEEMERIFDRFYRVDKARSREAGGTGLGLSIVRTMTEQYGGTVSVSRNRPAGSQFRVRIPRTAAGEAEQS